MKEPEFLTGEEVKEIGRTTGRWDNEKLYKLLEKAINYAKKHKKVVYIPFVDIEKYYNGKFKGEKERYVYIFKKVKDITALIDKNMTVRSTTITFKKDNKEITDKAIKIEP